MFTPRCISHDRRDGICRFPSEEVYAGTKDDASELLKWIKARTLPDEKAVKHSADSVPDSLPGVVGPLPMRPSLMPVPSGDVLAAARYSLTHEVMNAMRMLAGSKTVRKRHSALEQWLRTLHDGLPRAQDGTAPYIVHPI